jgi:hypothetical protein
VVSEVCDRVLLSDLRTRCITDAVKEQAKYKYDAMLGANMKPRSTSGMWVDNSGAWLVIYAGQRQQGDKIYRDGFEVRHSRLFIYIYIILTCTQADQIDYIVEQMQNHMSSLGVESPVVSGDQRHLDSMKYSFMDYDILTDGIQSM